MDEGTTGLRERTRRAVRGELITVAMGLFLEQGYESTTVEQISVAAGLSRRSFFRYFASKDEILAESLASVGESIAAALAARPQLEGPWPALRRSFDVLVADTASDERSRAMTRMMLQSPSMNASHATKHTSWGNSIVASLVPRLPQHGDSVLHAEALTAAALACLATAQMRWVEIDNNVALVTLLDTAMDAVGRAGERS